MTFGTFLYKLFIYPIEMVLEMVFYLGVRLFQNYGLCIVLISLVINGEKQAETDGTVAETHKSLLPRK